MSGISGIKFATAEAGIKKVGRKDLLLVSIDEGATVAGAFSTSYIVSPTIDVDRKHLQSGHSPRLLIVNSGNANSFTGSHGLEAIEKVSDALMQKFHVEREQIYISSTGVIGQKLPYEKITSKLDQLAESLSEDKLEEAAAAIMTTDTKPKFVSATSKIGTTDVKISAIAKGAGMAAPNLATVLSYIFTDAKIAQNVLQHVVSELIEDSFNAFTIDGDMSTNDTLLVFATGKAENETPHTSKDETLVRFKEDLKKLMIDLCNLIVADGEGVSKIMRIHVKGASSKESAKKVGLAIANSPLVKTALNGADPNWGRIVMAVGKAKEQLRLTHFNLDIGEFNIIQNGELNPDYDEHQSTAPYMKDNKEIDIYVDLGLGTQYQTTVTSCDLSKGYIEINADYRS